MAKSKSKELAAWRESHFSELEATLKVFKSVRDDPSASHKDKIEAGKAIGRLLSAMSPAKSGDKKPPKQVERKPTQDEWEEINRRLVA